MADQLAFSGLRFADALPTATGLLLNGEAPGTILAVRPNEIELARKCRGLTVRKLDWNIFAECRPDRF